MSKNIASEHLPKSHDNCLSKLDLDRVLFFVLAFCLLTFAIFDRFNGITLVGITGADTFSYWKKAQLWSQGDFLITKWYRPVAMLIYAAGMKVFGYHDYTIKLINCTADILTIFLLFGLALWLLRNKWLALAATSNYAFLPRIILQSRIELLHILSGTFVLLTLLFFISFLERTNWRKGKRYALLGTSGLLAGMAANIHPDLAFLGPAYVLCLFAFSCRVHEKLRDKIVSWILSSAIFTSCFLVPYVIGILCFGLEKTVYVMIGIGNAMTHKANSDAEFQLLQFLKNTMIKFISENSSFTMAYVFWGVLLCIALRTAIEKKEKLAAYLPLLLIVFHIVIFCLLTNKRVLSRLFIPFMPLVAILITFWYQKLFEIFFTKKFAAFLSIALSIYLLYTVRTIRPYNSEILISHTHQPSRFRSVYDSIKENVDDNHKLIIFPILVYRAGHGFNFDTYFGENAIYGMYVKEPVGPFLEKEKVKFIYIGRTDLDMRVIGGHHFLRSYRGGLSPEEYTLKKEYEYLNKLLSKYNGRHLQSWEHGDLYELNFIG